MSFDTQIAEAERRANEALTAWRSVLKEQFNADGDHGLDEATWTGQQKERVAKAKADFTMYSNRVGELRKEAADVQAAEEQLRANRVNRSGDYLDRESHAVKEGPQEMWAAVNSRAAIQRKDEVPATEPFYSHALRRFLTPIERQAHREAFAMWLQHGDERRKDAVERLEKAGTYGPSEIQLLSGVTGELGGFAVPEDFRQEVVRPRPGFAVIRAAGARVMPTTRDTLVMPRVRSGSDPYSSGVSGSWRGVGYVSGGTAPSTQNQPKLDNERVQVFWWQPDVIELDPSLIMDNAINLESVIAEELGRTRGLDEDSAFVNGSGSGQPQGVLNSGATQITLASAAVSYNTLIDLVQGLPAQYRAGGSHVMNSDTFGDYMKLETSSGVTLIFEGFARMNSNPGTPGVANLMGYPVWFSEFMPDVASGAKAQVFGDFFYYVIAQREELRIQRLIERYAPNIGLLASARVGGQVVLNDAFRIGVPS